MSLFFSLSYTGVLALFTGIIFSVCYFFLRFIYLNAFPDSRDSRDSEMKN